MTDTIDSLRIRIGELELALEEAEERNVSHELEQTTKALAKMNSYAAGLEREIQKLTGRAPLIAPLVEAQQNNTVNEWRGWTPTHAFARPRPDAPTEWTESDGVGGPGTTFEVPVGGGKDDE